MADSVQFNYSIVETPYGDYFRKITLRKIGHHYLGELVDDEDGSSHHLKVIKYDGKEFVFALKFDGLKFVFSCRIVGDSLVGTGVSRREDFEFLLKGKLIRN